MTYELYFSDGRKSNHDTYEAAVAAFATEYPDAEIGHDGDLSDGGDRTLCWERESDSANDDGAKAAASIHRLD